MIPVTLIVLAETLTGQIPAPPKPLLQGPPALRKYARIDQKLGATVPLDAEFRDSTGRAVRLGELITDRPVVLTLVYYECPMLCSRVLRGLLRTLRAMKMRVGEEFDIVTVSIDHGESPALAAAKKETYLQEYEVADEDGWRFLVGDAPAIAKLADAVGFGYAYDDTSDQYAHASGIMVLTPEGRVSQYLMGIEYSARDLRLALVTASDHALGNLVDELILFCFHYDPATGRYTMTIMNALRVGGAFTLLLLGGFVAFSLARETRRQNGRPARESVGP